MDINIIYRKIALLSLIGFCVIAKCQNLPYVTNANYSRETKAIQYGDVVLGGLFSVHFEYTPSQRRCTHMNERGVKWVQSMIYTVDQINDNPHLLPNITIGYDLRDTCNSPNNAIQESLNFVIYSHLDDNQNSDSLKSVLCDDEANNSIFKPKLLSHIKKKEQIVENKSQFSSIPNMIGVIGGRSSRVSLTVASLLSNFDIAQVSYSSTSRLLSNIIQYRSFFRTVPTDENQVQAMIDIVQHFNWTYVAIVAVDDSYGRLAADSFKKRAAALGLCIAVDQRFPNQNSQQAMQDIVTELSLIPRAKVIILLCAENEAVDFLYVVQRQNLTGRIFIGSDAWGDSPRIATLQHDIVEGMLGVVLDGHPVPQFEKYLKTLDLCNNKRNPWFNQLWYEKARMEKVPPDRNNCLIPFGLLHNYTDIFYQENSKVAYVMDAIYAIAYALHNMLQCTATSCNPLKTIDRSTFLQYLRNVTFNAISVKNFHFSPEGDALGIYQIKNLQPSSTHSHKLEFKTVGEWDMSQQSGSELRIQTHKIVWTAQHPDQVPISRCSDDCLPGTFRKFSSVISCCWECIPCVRNAISNSTNAEYCYNCLPGQVASSNLSECIDKAPITFQWNGPLSITVFILAGIVYLMILVTWIIIMKHRQSPVVKASNTLLTNFLLIGITACATSAVGFIAPISLVSCSLGLFISVISLVFILSTIMAKTNRVSKIFQSALSHSKNSSAFLKNSTQAFFVICLTSIEIVLTFSSLTVDPIEINRYLSHNNEVYLQCNTRYKITFYSTISYLIVLNMVCLYLAFKTRKLPENYNEAKFISFTSLIITCFLSTIIPAYFSTIGSFRAGVASIGLLCLSCAILCCMFLPKVYILLFESNTNTKENAILDLASYSFGNANTASFSSNRTAYKNTAIVVPLLTNSSQTSSGTLSSSSSLHIGRRSIKVAGCD